MQRRAPGFPATLPSLAMADTRTCPRAAFEAPQWYFDRLGYRVQLRAQIISEMANHITFERLIDIGCGDGSISLPLLTPDRSLTLQDLSENMLKRAKSRVPAHLAHNVTVVSGDFRELDLGQRFGLVICLGVLAYVDSLGPFLDKLSSLVEQRGHVIIECSDNDHFISSVLGFYSKLRRIVRRPELDIELHPHSSSDVAAAFEKLGFALVQSYRYSSPPPVLHKLFSQRFHYRVNRVIHGSAARNAAAWLGKECIFHFQKQTS